MPTLVFSYPLKPLISSLSTQGWINFPLPLETHS